MKINSEKIAPGSVEFGNVQTVQKFAGRVTANLDFKGTPLFDVEYIRKDTR